MPNPTPTRPGTGGTAELLRPTSQPETDERHQDIRTIGERPIGDDLPASGGRDEGVVPLLTPDAADGFASRWEAAQRSFVDDPRTSVQEADQLVADLVKQLATQFATERSNLEEQWSRGEDVDTETLRVTLQRYRSFFNRLLKV